MTKGTDICKGLLWHSKMYVLTKSTSFSFWAAFPTLPTVKLVWLMEYMWKCDLYFQARPVQISFMWLSILPCSDFGGHIAKVMLSKDGRNLGFLNEWVKQSRLPHSPAADYTDLWFERLVVTPVGSPWHTLLLCAGCNTTHIHAFVPNKNWLKNSIIT